MTSAKITAIGKPTVSEDNKASLQQAIDDISKAIAEGEISGMVAVVVRPDSSFAIAQAGALRRIETIGLLEQAKHDLLMEQEFLLAKPKI